MTLGIEGGGVELLPADLSEHFRPGRRIPDEERSAELDPARFAMGAFGSDSPRRADLPAVAARRASERTGRRFTGDDLVVVGDTPDDVACARPMGARTVAVATGFYKADALRAAGATHVFENLGDTQAVLAALFA